jgi:hypothetical protein
MFSIIDSFFFFCYNLQVTFDTSKWLTVHVRHRNICVIYSCFIVTIRQRTSGKLLFVVCFIQGDSPASEFHMPKFRNTLFHLHTYSHMKMEQSVPKLWHINFRRRGNHPEESVRVNLSKHGESFKSRINCYLAELTALCN